MRMRFQLLLLCLTAITALPATTYISDGASVSGVWTVADGPYEIEREAIVPEGEALTIEPGVEVLFASTNQEANRARLVVYGSLTAVGTAQNPISFNPSGFQYWGAIVFEDTDTENNQLIHCNITGASRYPNGDNVYGSVALYNARVYMQDCTVSGNSYFGVAIRDGSIATLQDCTIQNNDYSAVYVRNGSEAHLYDCDLISNSDYGLYIREESIVGAHNCLLQANHQDGVFIRENSQLELTECEIADNNFNGIDGVTDAIINLHDCDIHDNGFDGVHTDYADLVITDCDIYGNNDDGLQFSYTYQPLIQDCEIYDNSDMGIYTSFASSAVISGCSIYGNGMDGVYSGEDGSPLFTGNEICNNGRDGVNTYRSTTMLENNLIHHNGRMGLFFYCWDDSGATGNIIWANGQSTLWAEVYVRYHSWISLTNNTIICVDNNYAVREIEISTTSITNCILNQPCLWDEDCAYSFAWSLLTEAPPEAFDEGGNIVGEDPVFVDTLNFDFHLADGSPCLDAGNPDMTFFTLPAVDLDGYPRIWPDRIDIGAYERYSDQPPTISGWEPEEQDFTVESGDAVEFAVHASDWEPVGYDWRVNGESSGADSVFAYTFADEGFYVVQVVISDGQQSCETRWTIHAESVSTVDDTLPAPLALLPLANPSRGSITLRYSLPQRTDVQIAVYDVRGRRVNQWRETGLTQGAHALLWDGRDASGAAVGSGVYLVRLRAGDEARTTRVTLLR